MKSPKAGIDNFNNFCYEEYPQLTLYLMLETGNMKVDNKKSMKINLNNTKKQGIARIFIYQEKKKYIGVNLDFYLVEECDTKERVRETIINSSIDYLRTVIKNELSDNLLNRHAPEKYWEMYRKYNELLSVKPVIQSPDYQIIKNSSSINVSLNELLQLRDSIPV